MNTTVISICTLKHADVWKLTSKLLPENLEADHFVVYVPENEIVEFKRITNPRIAVESQSLLGLYYTEELRQVLAKTGNDWRFGWYLQQFFKIEAMLISASERVVIWDADCVPVKRIKTFDEMGNPTFMSTANEMNPSYFQVIEKLIGLKRVQDMSFVVPAFPFLRPWLEEFKADVEKFNGGKPWYTSIIECTDFSQMSGFSETETLGTWMANNRNLSWSKNYAVWERRGQKRFGFARKMTVNKVVMLGESNNLDIISFENWDVRGLKLVFKRLGEMLKN